MMHVLLNVKIVSSDFSSKQSTVEPDQNKILLDPELQLYISNQAFNGKSLIVEVRDEILLQIVE
jgi:hypothetical protein